MKHIPIFLSLILVCALTACPDAGQAPPPPPMARPPDPPKPNLEARIEVEQRLRQQTEARLSRQESTTSYWQKLTLAAVAAGSLLLVVGTALGSKARHDADTSSSE